MPYRCCLLHTEYLSVHYEPTTQLLVNQWRGQQDAQQVREHVLFIHDCLRAHTCTRILSDHSALQGSWQELTEWLIQRMFARFAFLGVQFFAWVPSAYFPLNRAAMEAVAQAMTTPTVRLFDDVQAATSWLQQ